MDAARLGEEVAGRRRLTLLIVPGFMGTAAGWRPFLSHLGSDIRVEWWFAERQPPNRVLPLLRRRLARPRRDRLVALGYSQGARLLFAALQDRRAHPDGVVLISGRPPLADTLERARRRATDRRRAALVRRVGMHGFLAYWRTRPMIRSQQRVAPASRMQRRAERLRLDPRRTAAVLEALGPGALRTDADRAPLDIPSLAIAGAADPVYCRLLSRWEAEFVGIDCHVVADAGHAPQFEQPHRTAAIVAPFLAGLQAVPGRGVTGAASGSGILHGAVA